MSRTSTLILLGVVGILTPFSGLPMAFRSLLTVVVGLATLAIGVSLRRHEVHAKQTGVE